MWTLVHLVDCISLIFYHIVIIYWVVVFLDCWLLEFYHKCFSDFGFGLGFPTCSMVLFLGLRFNYSNIDILWA
jgi:hypothetical protein